MRKKHLQILTLVSCAGFATAARAGTITGTDTSATAATMTCNKQATFFSSCSESVAAGSATAVANVLGGHLGALASATAQAYVAATAYTTVDLALNDMTADDFLGIGLSLDGSFSPGSGALASLYIDNGDSISTWQVGCSSLVEQLHGVPCFPNGGLVQTLYPLDNLDNLTVRLLLQAGLGSPPAYSDFLNSADFTITVPSGTNLVNNPGGTLFQGVTAVPEPNPGLLAGSGLILALLLGKRSR